MASDKKDFHIVEYESVREEILLHINLAQNIVLFCPVSCAALASWLLTQLPSKQPVSLPFILAAWLPLAISVICTVYHFQLLRAMYRAGDYVQLLEKRFGFEDLGWQRFVRNRKGKYKFRTWVLGYASFLIQILFSIYLGIYVQRCCA
jgi:hypothetical protein